MKIFILSFFLIPCFVSAATQVQNISQRERSLFQKNVSYYKAGDYETAEKNFSLIISKLPNSEYITANYLMLIKTQYKLADYTPALNLAKKFLEKFPQSSYIDDIYYVMGNCYYRLNRIESAVRSWINILDNSNNDLRLINKSAELISASLQYKLSNGEIQRLANDVVSPEGQLLIRICQAEKLLVNNSFSQSSLILQKAISQYPNSRFRERAEVLLSRSNAKQSNKVRFALLMPLSGNNASIGKAIKEGAEFALEKFKNQSDSNIELIVKDYGEEIVKAIQIIKDLAMDESVVAVLGPLENDVAAACAVVSDYEKLPLFSPTATENNLTGISNYFYQLNGTLDNRAETLARYALDSLNIKRFATFAPIDNQFIQMVNKFVETLEFSGADLVAQEWYYPGEQDFNKQFMKLKRKGLKYSFIDSMKLENEFISQGMIDTLYTEYIKDEKERIKEYNLKVDSADIPVTGIQGVFIPIYKEDMKFIAPQIAYSNIQAQYIGNSDWYDPDELKKNKNYINGIIFGTDGFINEENWDYKKFRNDFRENMKKTPDQYNLIGFDSFKFMLSAIKSENNNFTRENYLNNIRSITKYKGLYRTINLNVDRYNYNLFLLKYAYGQIIPLH